MRHLFTSGKHSDTIDFGAVALGWHAIMTQRHWSAIRKFPRSLNLGKNTRRVYGPAGGGVGNNTQESRWRRDMNLDPVPESTFNAEMRIWIQCQNPVSTPRCESGSGNIESRRIQVPESESSSQNMDPATLAHWTGNIALNMKYCTEFGCKYKKLTINATYYMLTCRISQYKTLFMHWNSKSTTLFLLEFLGINCEILWEKVNFEANNLNFY